MVQQFPFVNAPQYEFFPLPARFHQACIRKGLPTGIIVEVIGQTDSDPSPHFIDFPFVFRAVGACWLDKSGPNGKLN